MERERERERESKRARKTEEKQENCDSYVWLMWRASQSRERNREEPKIALNCGSVRLPTYL